ncbi:MAG: DNA replication/repair protein RecF, partial [Pseudomonadota bacterium]
EDFARQPENIGWKVSATLQAGDTQHDISCWAEPGNPRLTEIDGKSATQTALSRIVRILWLTPAMDRLWQGPAADRRQFLDRLTMSFEPAHAEAAIAYEKAMRERNRLLRDGIRDAGWFDALEAQLAETGSSIAANRRIACARLEAAQADAATAFPTAQLRIEETDTPPEADAETLRQALGAGRARDAAAGRTLVGPHRADLVATFAAKDTPARLSSTGEQKALLISLVLANARALAADFGAPPILLLDEVAAHLDADRRAALYGEVTALGAQTWMTGTGAGLFEALGDAALRYAVREDDGVSTVQPA